MDIVNIGHLTRGNYRVYVVDSVDITVFIIACLEVEV